MLCGRVVRAGLCGLSSHARAGPSRSEACWQARSFFSAPDPRQLAPPELPAELAAKFKEKAGVPDHSPTKLSRSPMRSEEDLLDDTGTRTIHLPLGM